MSGTVEKTGGPLVAAHQQVVIEPSRGVSLQLKALWQYRELLYFLVWRDLKVRYKQTALGVAWIALQPLASILIYTLVFSWLLKVPSGNVPYPVFAYAALLPWSYFAASLNRSSTSLVLSANLISKIYFPRLVIPISSVLSGLVDFGVSFFILIGMMLFYGIVPTWNVLLLPLFILLAVMTALGFGLWLSALNVRYRDVTQLVPVMVQLWMYLTPVIYGSTLIPQRFQVLMSLNPMTGVVEGFRWALLGARLETAQAPGLLFYVSIAISLVVLVSGIVFFRYTERTFADVI
jgi:lipopolysaccharide transport system permease protein